MGLAGRPRRLAARRQGYTESGSSWNRSPRGRATPGKSRVGDYGAQLEWTAAGHLKLFATADYTATTDGDAIVAGKAGLGFRF